MWQRYGSWNISWYFVVLGRVTRKRGRFVVFGSLGEDRQVVVICLTLTNSNLRLTSPPQMSSTGVLVGRWRMTAFIGFSDFGKNV
jgi:hypothetical protein